MLNVLIQLLTSAVAAVAGHHQAVAQDQEVVSPNLHVAVANQVPNPEEVPTRVARARVHVVHLDAAKLEFVPPFSSP